MRRDGHRQLRIITLYVAHGTLQTCACGQSMSGHFTLVLMTPVLHHPHERRAAMEYTPVLVPLLARPLLPLHFF